MKYLNFENVGKKIKTFLIYNDIGIRFGVIYWHATWKKYVFESYPNIAWTLIYLNEVGDFLTKLKEERRCQLKKKKENH